ncbi:MAG: hypothetical protein P1U36_03335 [Legionellaceae bacterium]|nr:hypothetical protein [Legionellaceae bacterium]
MKIFNVLYNYPFHTNDFEPGELVITISDIKGTCSNLYLVEENTSDIDLYYGKPLAPDLLLVGTVATADLDKETLDELKAARFRLNTNHIGPLELSDDDAAKILHMYEPQSPTTVTSRAPSPIKLTASSLSVFNLMYESPIEQNKHHTPTSNFS